MNPRRFVLIAINVTYLLLSVVLINIGFEILSEYHYGHSSLLKAYTKAGATANLGFGGLVIILAITYLIAIHEEHKRTLYTCVGVLLVAIGVEVGGGLTCWFKQVEQLELITSALRSAQLSYMKNSSTTETWDLIQQHVRCCGVDSYTEWYNYLDAPRVPDSCCIQYAVDCGIDAVEELNIYAISCNKAIREWAWGNLTPSLVIYSLIVVLQAISIAIGQAFLSDLENP